MAELGRINRLRVVRRKEIGLYLDDGSEEGVLLPNRYVPQGAQEGDEIEVFLYRDSEDRKVATTERPKAQVGEFALLRVKEVSRHGIFLDWGLTKDLLLPFNEQESRIEAGQQVAVRIFIDEQTQRIVASARLDDFLHPDSQGEFAAGEEVQLFNARRSEIGYTMIVNNSHWGLLHKSEATRELRRGERLTGYIKQIRPDGRIDLCLHRKPSEKSDELGEAIVEKVRRAGGFMAVGDFSAPDEIERQFGVSKRMFKKAIGGLYRKGAIAIEPQGIRLLDK